MKWIYTIYLFISAGVLLAGLIYTFVKPHHLSIESPLRMMFLFGAIVLSIYPAGMLADSYQTACILFGACYFSVDLMLIGLRSFIRKYTNIRKYNLKLQIVVCLIAIIDGIFMLMNCYKPIAFRVEQSAGKLGGTFWHIGQKEAFYFYHECVIFVIVVLLMIDLVRKILRSPKIYQVKYAIIMIFCCMIFAVHSAYIKFQLKVDYSLFLIAIFLSIVFYFSIFYIPRGLMDRLMFFTISNMQDGIICLDIDNHCVHANKSAKIYCDHEINLQVESWFAKKISSDTESSSWSSVRRIDGEMRYYEIEYKKMFDVHGRHIGCFFIMHDRTEEKTRLFAEKYSATHDALTGIYNKEYFYDAVRELIQDNPEKEYIIVCTDVKNFKIINDVFGVEAGDQFLTRIADSIRSMSQESWIYARLSGDKFAVCMPKEEFSEKQFLQETAKLSELSENYLFKILFHIGVYPIEDRSLRISVMCDRANLAIQTIKGSYENSVAYYKETLRENFLNEQKMISEFDAAIRSGEFQAYVQPQVFSQNGKIMGGEVLVRWIHQDSGMIPPYKFIPVFEQTGLIGKLDSYMWWLACQKLQEWQNLGLTEHYLSVNISQKDFYLLDVYQVLTSMVEKYHLNPKNLHLEITETAIMDNPTEQLPLIRKLRDYGFLVEIDDFGSGYSSLNSLKDLHVDVLKVDMGFLRKTEHQERSKIILNMVISLAKSLQMEVITEGVETKEQVDFLKDYGCDIFQGYHFAKPMPVHEFEEKFLNHTVEV